MLPDLGKDRDERRSGFGLAAGRRSEDWYERTFVGDAFSNSGIGRGCGHGQRGMLTPKSPGPPWLRNIGNPSCLCYDSCSMRCRRLLQRSHFGKLW